MAYNVPALGEVANFGTDYFISSVRPVASGLLNYKFLAKRKREFTTKLAIARNGCYPHFIIASS
jgi:hypothetical protein